MRIEEMRILLLLFVFTVFVSCSNNISYLDMDATLESSDVAYDQLNLRKSRMILNIMLENDSLNNDTKCNVLLKLAHQDWKHYKNYDIAKSRLLIADSIDGSKSEIWLLLSRIERESRNYQNALLASEKAKKYAKSLSDKTNANIEYAKSVYELSIDNIINKIPLDSAMLIKTSNLLIEELELNVGSPEPSQLLLGISLLQNNGANVLKAWKSYFHILDLNKSNLYLSGAANELNEVCKDWSGEKLSHDKQEKLILALCDSRFYKFVHDYTLSNCSEKNYNHQIKDILIYSQYLKTVEKQTNEYYRRIAIEEADESEYIKWLYNTRKELWQALSFSLNKEYDETKFLDETERYFGAKGLTGPTGNYNGYVLCLGHIINQEKAVIKQYGYKPEFTFTQIDMMTSNGYSSWFWNDKAIGGWAEENEIIQVREVYLNGPYNAWKLITDTVERKKAETQINEFINQPYTDDIYMQTAGLSIKLEFDALNDLYNKFYSEGLRGNTLKLAFLSTYEKYGLEASILSHEGRHSIEKKYMPELTKYWSSGLREFHAKLSEIVFASEPRLVLAGMVNLISDSGHGQANKRINEIGLNWIINNSQLIEGFSPDKSLFSQLYLLTNEQIRQCYKSADPLFLSQNNN